VCAKLEHVHQDATALLDAAHALRKRRSARLVLEATEAFQELAVAAPAYLRRRDSEPQAYNVGDLEEAL
jgi:hypothetical protein